MTPIKMAKVFFNFVPKWRNFPKSGHTGHQVGADLISSYLPKIFSCVVDFFEEFRIGFNLDLGTLLVLVLLLFEVNFSGSDSLTRTWDTNVDKNLFLAVTDDANLN